MVKGNPHKKAIHKSGKGFKVISPSGHAFSKKPLTKAKATRQLDAIKISQMRRGKG